MHIKERKTYEGVTEKLCIGEVGMGYVSENFSVQLRMLPKDTPT